MEFDRDIRPIFSDTCFKCHGPDEVKRKGKLRLDVRVGAFAEHDGHAAIVPGDLAKSEAWRRLNATGTDDLMPPAESGLKLTPRQVQLFSEWIKQGAKYAELWSFIPPTTPRLPEVKAKEWPRNEIDSFILARLEAEKLSPNPEADRRTLIRRLSLDLTGLPPIPAEVEQFVSDQSPQAYEKLVDRLLQSPHYGERMAVEWLDAARFADTHGYHIDSGRDMTRWREWVIESFNQNLPFDQFTVDQLAGDLLPNATTDQKVASGFNRNHMINFEGGAIPEEYHTAYLIDRVNTTATVWLGLTMGCVQCHDHKYDPLTMKDFYSLYAFFNNVPENGLDGSKGNAAPVMPVPSPDQSKLQKQLAAELSLAEAKLKECEEHLSEAQTKWEDQEKAKTVAEPASLKVRFALDNTLDGSDRSGTPIKATYHGAKGPAWEPARVGKGLKLDGSFSSFVSAGSALNPERTNAFSYGCWVKQSSQGQGTLFSKMDVEKSLRGFDLFVAEGKLMVHLIHSWPDNVVRVESKMTLPKDSWTHVFATYDGSSKASGIKLYIDGKPAAFETLDDKLSDTIINDAEFQLGMRSTTQPLKGSLADVRFYDRVLGSAEINGLVEAPNLMLARIPVAERSPEQQQSLKNYFKDHRDPEYAKAKQAVEKVRKSRDELEKAIPTTMVMSEMEKPRDTFILMRGAYDKHGDKVTARTPTSLPAMPEGAPNNRLGLAKWLTASNNPLTSRVTVNRFWQMYFGTGIVKTAEDFGSQGEFPSHPELLDWLASDFMQHGWDVKRLQKLIVMSASYRQSSVVTKEMSAHDPENRLIAHGPRMRLQAEFIRDQALAVSGLLNDQIGGKSVSPYQPAGLWEELASREDGRNWSAQTYTQSHGKDLYRRTMYTFWKRTSPPPTLATFDAPDRETCVVRRPRTNTPLQALVLMNDPTYIEASRKLAERMMLEAKSDADRVTLAFRLATSRAPKEAEMKVLLKLYHDQLEACRTGAASAQKLLEVGEANHDGSLNPEELAAWTMVASTILNLDETVTKG